MTTLTVPELAARVTDGQGRCWAKHPNGSWQCLGHALSVDTLAELDARYIVIGGVE